MNEPSPYLSRINRDLYEKVLAGPKGQEIVAALDASYASNSEACVVVGGDRKPSYLQMRHNGAKTWLSIRALYWLHLYDDIPIFGHCTCGVRGCTNPRHQAPVASDPASRHRIRVVETQPDKPPVVENYDEALSRLLQGDFICYSLDGELAWFGEGDRAEVDDAVVKKLRSAEMLERTCDERGCCWDAASEKAFVSFASSIASEAAE